MSIAVFPGSFDPVTTGHTDIINRASKVFGHLFIALGNNQDKNYMFSLENRLTYLNFLFGNRSDITIKPYQGLTIDFCKSVGASYIIRGARNTLDFEYEKSIAFANSKLDSSIETIILISKPEHAGVSSSIVRDIIRNSGDASGFIPEGLNFS